MRYEIIKTDDYLLVLDYKDVQPGDSFLLNFDHPNGRIRRCHRVCDDGKEDLLMIDPDGFGFSYRQECKRISAHLPLNGALYIDGMDVLPPTWRAGGEDVDSWITETVGNLKDEHTKKTAALSLKGGYNKAREKYKFTEEDARQLIMYSFLKGVDRGHYSKEIEDRIIQTIQQPKLPIAFESEISNPMFALSIEPKRTTNAEGRTEWVGKYIYN